MMKENTFAIWPPYEAFYIESMNFSLEVALESLSIAQDILDNSIQDNESEFLSHIHNFLNHSAILSRYFWPARKDLIHSRRADFLKKALEITDESPLKNRDLRNGLEHFDEKLDVALNSNFIAGNIIPAYVGPSTYSKEIPTYFFRAYYTDKGIFRILNQEYDISPIVNEVNLIYQKFSDIKKNGYRFY